MKWLYVFVASTLMAATPTISNVVVTTDTNAALVSYTVSPDSYCWVQYGVVSGTYLWSSVTYLTGVFPSPAGVCSVPITGLKDGTTYYFLPTARPDADDEANICNASQCGAVERAATTPPASVSHLPAPPVSVAANLMTEPDTSGYAIVTLADGGAGVNHECVASSTVGAPAGYSWTIPAGQTLTQIITNNEMTFGTVFQVPQGLTCMVPPSDTQVGNGYNLPVLAVDPLATGGSITAPNHRWIIFRSVQNGAADFPPLGTRADPQFASRYGGFESVTPMNNRGLSLTGGMIFQDVSSANGLACHHIWIENLMFSVDATQATGHYDGFLYFGHAASGVPPPYPQYIVIRNNYFHGPVRGNVQSGAPSVEAGIVGTPVAQVAIVGNYFDNLYYTYASDAGAYGAGLAFGIYFTDPVGGPVLIDNNYMHGMAMNIYIEVNNHLLSPHDFTITHNSLYWPYDITYPYAAAVSGYGCRDQIERKGMLRGLVNGNYINGQWACANTGTPILAFATVDDTITSNYITHSASVINVSGMGNDTAMQPFVQSGNRVVVANNLAFNLGRGLYNAGGGGMGDDVLEMDTSADNVTFVNNTVGPINDGHTYYPWLFNNSSGAGPIAGLVFKNNVLPFGISNAPYGGGIGVQNGFAGAGGASHPATPLYYGGSPSPVAFSSWLGTSAGYTDGAANLGVQGASVIAGGSGYGNGSLSFTGCTVAPVGTYTSSGGAVQSTNLSSFGSGCNPATFTASAGPGGASLRPAYGLTTSYKWSGNVNYCTAYNGSDMSQDDCNSLSSSMPSTDIYPAGATTAMRQAAAGLINASLSDYRCYPTTTNSCFAGVNMNVLESALGIVSHIGVQVTATSAGVSYMAPDSRACAVDLSPDGVNWTRETDAGGMRNRSVWFAGLTASTGYRYRLLCYYDQTGEWFSFPSEPTNMATDGTFTTLAAVTRNVAIPFSLFSFSGATSFKATLTGVGGQQYSNTCTTSPCSVPNVPVGDYSTVQQWWAGSTLLASSDAQIVQVR